MHKLFGSQVLSSSMLAKLKLQLADLGVKLGEARNSFIYLVDGHLDKEELTRLEGLLEAVSCSYGSLLPSTYFVFPRWGTISPWSSKATDIAHNCGLNNVRRLERARFYNFSFLEEPEPGVVEALLHDRMVEVIQNNEPDWHDLFSQSSPRSISHVPIGSSGSAALNAANSSLGLALTSDEIDYLLDSYTALERDPTDVELMMFAQANSEHCRHKIFNADWVIDGEKKEKSLFQMIKKTFEVTPDNVLSAYKDNASVMSGPDGYRFFPDTETGIYKQSYEPIHTLMKVETHNHPTAISPYSGASTGAGGEIRDEGATGIGGKPKAGLTGFTVSNLRIPGNVMPWEQPEESPCRIASPLQIMLEGPIGASSFNNEFGRPNICGYFRTFEVDVGNCTRGYHKPIMLAGGLGNIRDQHVKKRHFSPGALIIVLGGPAMLIGLGGGAASSLAGGASDENLDFASVQRDNPEMERRCQEVIDRCWALGDSNPIAFIHDVGAGGLSNAVPEIVNDAGWGGVFELRDVPSDDAGMSPLEIWCNESQERYVLAIEEKDLARFEKIAARERCPFAVIGVATNEKKLRVSDRLKGGAPVEMPLDVLLGKPPKMVRNEASIEPKLSPLTFAGVTPAQALKRVLLLPTVGDKSFLITIGDRSVTGLVYQDQMVGPWQVPVADAGVTAIDYEGFHGEAMSVGERPPVALISPAAASRLCVAEALTNLAGQPIGSLTKIKLSANWQAAPNHRGEGAALYEAVEAVGEHLCPNLGLTIPVGKDSMSMKTAWSEGAVLKEVVSPVSLVISAFAQVNDIRKSTNPMLQRNQINSELIFLDLAGGRNRLGGSCLAQVYGQVGDSCPDLDEIGILKSFWQVMQRLVEEKRVLAYHDRSDGGLIVTLCEMAFAGMTGLTIDISDIGEGEVLERLFSEELGGVIQVSSNDVSEVMKLFSDSGVCARRLGKLNSDLSINVVMRGATIICEKISDLRDLWSKTSFEMQKLRDNPDTSQQEHAARLDIASPGLSPFLTFDIKQDVVGHLKTGLRPHVAVLREQGVNGHFEMAAAFHRVGFEAIDVHMKDLLSGRFSLSDFSGLAVCGGFSYGDVLGAGQGWAKTILGNESLKESFSTFFKREDTFTLGVCNGCQMLSQLKCIIPGADHWPSFQRNISEQFEARLSLVKVAASPSIFLRGMADSVLPVIVSHGEGRAVFSEEACKDRLEEQELIGLRYVDPYGSTTERFPYNPNGSEEGITALTTVDGRVTIMMPHPERVFRAAQFSWCPESWGDYSPWNHFFANARLWVSHHN